MAVNKHAKAELNDLTDKLRGAEAAANSDEAGEREKADLKLLEQEVVAKKLRAKRPPSKEPAAGDVEAKLDKALKDSFPGSDPVSFVEAAPIKKEDRGLSTVPDEDEDAKGKR
ncbi:MAG TPA: hypothetical protein VLA02_08840 [Reyranella sp.]|nr:hypothetical protein [Reyranella sp.]